MFIDIVAGILIGIGMYQGYSQGLIRTLFAALSIIIAIVASLKLSPLVIGMLQRNLDFNPAILFLIGFVLTFLVVMALIRFIGTKIDAIFKDLNITLFNKLAGATLLGLLYAIIISYGLHFMDRIKLVSENQKASSITYPYLKPLPAKTTAAGQKLKPVFSDFWDALMNTMDSIKDKGDKLTQPDEQAG